MINIRLIREETGEEFHIEQQASEKTLLAILQEHQIYIDAFCGGSGECGRCQVRFLEGAPEPSAKDKRMLSEAELEDGMRLACAVNLREVCKIILPSGEREKIAVLEQSDLNEKKRADKQIESGQTEDRPIMGGQMEHENLRSAYGIAVDIGTTTLAAVLIDLSDGARRASASSVNHQRAYGADVISRIQAANEGKGALLQQSIQHDLKKLMEQLVQQGGILREQIKEVVIAGNTTMCHLLRGLSCAGLGVAPFVPEDISLWEGTVNELLNTGDYQARAIIFPGISAFVGADIVAGMYANDMDVSEQMQMLLDIGTNGEMVLGNRDGFLMTSAAAGPVFEGGNISCGVPGIPGAVTHVSLQRGAVARDSANMINHGAVADGSDNMINHGAAADDRDEVLDSSYETIQNEPPVGLCGTGIIDVTSELVRLGIVDENGTMAEPWFETGVPVAGETVVFTQRDVREIQMGKSAIRAGIETLLLEAVKAKKNAPEYADGEGKAKTAEKADDTLDIKVLLAGGFGYYMDAKKAIGIGLFPQSFDGNIKMIGNSALEGAVRFLTDDRQQAKARIGHMVLLAKEINLALHPAFNDIYLQHMFF